MLPYELYFPLKADAERAGEILRFTWLLSKMLLLQRSRQILKLNPIRRLQTRSSLKSKEKKASLDIVRGAFCGLYDVIPAKE
jgi:hypothetical protein